jgi:hypothetical protein
METAVLGQRPFLERLDICNKAKVAVKIGIGVAIAPIALTSLIACSKIILINVIANVAIFILSGGALRVTISASFVSVPLLWKFSFLAMKVGTSVVAVSLVILLGNAMYEKIKK